MLVNEDRIYNSTLALSSGFGQFTRFDDPYSYLGGWVHRPSTWCFMSDLWVSIQREQDGKYWTGSVWVAPSGNTYEDLPRLQTVHPNWLSIVNDTDWHLAAPAPKDADLPESAYWIYVFSEWAGSFCECSLGMLEMAGARVHVDRTPPKVEITWPENRAVLTEMPRALGTTWDETSDVYYIEASLQRRSDNKYWSDGQMSHNLYGSPVQTNGWVDGGYQMIIRFDPRNWIDPFESPYRPQVTALWTNSTLPSFTALGEGVYTYRVRAADRAANTGEKTITFTIDRTPPAPPTISFPANQSTIPILSNIAGTAVDNLNGGGIGHVTFILQRVSDRSFWDGAAWKPSTLYSTPPQLETTGVWLPSPPGRAPQIGWGLATNLPFGSDLLNGEYNVRARAWDKAGNSTWGNAVNFWVNRNIPTLSLYGLTNGQSCSTLFPSLSGFANVTAGLSVSEVFLYLTYHWEAEQGITSADWTGSEWWDRHNVVLPTTVSGNRWYYTGALPEGDQLFEGEYSVLAYVKDSAGSSNWIYSTVYVDRTPPPAPTFTNPTHVAVVNQLPFIEGDTQDNLGGSGIERVHLVLGQLRWQTIDWEAFQIYVCWNGTNWQDSEAILGSVVSHTNWACVSPLPTGTNLLGGVYMLRATAVDHAGNLGPPALCEFTIDMTSPTLNVTWPSNQTETVDLPSYYVRGMASDDNGGSGLSHQTLSLCRDSDRHFWTGTGWSSNLADWRVSELSDSWTNSVPLPAGPDLPLGDYTLTAEAYDLAGNSTNQVIHFKVIPRNPAPSLTRLEPAVAFAGDPSMLVCVWGTDLVPGARVLLNESWMPLQGGTTNYILGYLDKVYLERAGSHRFTLWNPDPGGGWSDTFNFQVLPRPVVANDDFAAAPALGGYFVQTTGNNAGASAELMEPILVDRHTGGRSVWWTWTAPDFADVTIRTAGSAFDTLLAVFTGPSLANLARVASNNDRGGAMDPTSEVTFLAEAGVEYHIAVDGVQGEFGDIALVIDQVLSSDPPRLLEIQPASGVVGSPGFTLHALGGNFNPNAVIRWNSATLPTTFVNGRELTAAIRAEQLGASGTARIEVFIPFAGGSATNLIGRYSSTLVFTIYPAPIITSVNLTSVPAGSDAFLLIVEGRNFENGAVVRWGGVPQPTTHLGSNRLAIVVLPSLIAATSAVTLSVANPTSGGASLNSSFTVSENPPHDELLLEIEPAISWPAGLSAGFILEEADSLSSQWSPVGVAPAQFGDRNVFLLDPVHARRFYRLHKP